MADTLGWRWEFGVQVPAILLCLVAIVILVPNDLGLVGKRETFMEAMRVFDFKGSILLTASTTFLILGLVGSSSYIALALTEYILTGRPTESGRQRSAVGTPADHGVTRALRCLLPSLPLGRVQGRAADNAVGAATQLSAGEPHLCEFHGRPHCQCRSVQRVS